MTDRKSFGGVAPARQVALEALLRSEEESRFAGEVLQHLLPGCDERDRRLATALTFGVIRHRLTLDHILRAFSHAGKEPRPRELREVLRLGLFQMLYLDRIPAHAAISQAVEMAKGVSPASAGYTNGLLRSIQNAVGPGDGDDPCALLPRPDGRSLQFDRPIFPPPERAVESLSVTTSHPAWLIQRWLGCFGPERARQIALASNAVLPVTLRANVLHGPSASLHQELLEAGRSAAAGTRAEALQTRRAADPRDLPGYADGDFSVQDETAMAVAPKLVQHHPSKILELCAGVGGKSTHLAELTGDGTPVVALERSAMRLALLAENARRLGLSSILPLRADAVRPPLRPAFDGILLDAPCTNSGVLARRPEARWRLAPEDFARCAGLQGRLLAAAAALLVPGGRLVYSTCSIDPEENDRVVEGFLRMHFGFRLVESRCDLPSSEAGGGYWALLASSY